MDSIHEESGDPGAWDLQDLLLSGETRIPVSELCERLATGDPLLSDVRLIVGGGIVWDESAAFIGKSGYRRDKRLTVFRCASAARALQSHMLIYSFTTVDGLRELLASLESNSSLRELTLFGNAFGDDEVCMLAAWLATNPPLRKLSLSALGDAGRLALIDAIAVNTSLRDIIHPLESPLGNFFARNNVLEKELADRTKRKAGASRVALQRALAHGGESKPLKRGKIVVVGRGGAGKTSLVKALLGLPFLLDEPSTQGGVVLDSMTCASGEQWQKVKHPLSDFRRCAIDPTTQVPLAQAAARPTPAQGGDRLAESRSSPASSTQAHSTEMLETDFRQLVINMALKTTGSARNADAVLFTFYDMAGQPVFYDLLNLLLSRASFYLVVFSIKNMLTDRVGCLAYLRAWLASIMAFAPGARLAIVGTNKDKFPDANIEALCDGILEACQGISALDSAVQNSDGQYLFAIANNNAKDPVLSALRMAIETSFTENPETFISHQVSVSWLALLDLLRLPSHHDTSQPRASAAGYGSPRLHVTEVRSRARAFGMLEAETDEFLKFFHELGLLLHFSDIVVVNPQWLITSIAAVMRVQENVQRPKALKPTAAARWNMDLTALREHAQLSGFLLQNLWPDHTADEQRMLIRLMLQYHMLLCIDRNGDELDPSRIYLVPALMIESLPSPTPLAATPLPPPSDEQPDASGLLYAGPAVSLAVGHGEVYIHFSLDDITKILPMNRVSVSTATLANCGFIPPGLFRQLLCALITAAFEETGIVSERFSRCEITLPVSKHQTEVYTVQLYTHLSALRLCAPHVYLSSVLNAVTATILAVLQPKSKDPPLSVSSDATSMKVDDSSAELSKGLGPHTVALRLCPILPYSSTAFLFLGHARSQFQDSSKTTVTLPVDGIGTLCTLSLTHGVPVIVQRAGLPTESSQIAQSTGLPVDGTPVQTPPQTLISQTSPCQGRSLSIQERAEIYVAFRNELSHQLSTGAKRDLIVLLVAKYPSLAHVAAPENLVETLEERGLLQRLTHDVSLIIDHLETIAPLSEAARLGRQLCPLPTGVRCPGLRS
eukprot:m.93730 g.93730  ORF g.93730 m.93730 type:complete len:1064 (+) comp8549_c0_seq5:2-3193(+)